MRSQSRKLDRAIVEAARHLEPRPDHYAVWLLQKRGDFSPLKNRTAHTGLRGDKARCAPSARQPHDIAAGGLAWRGCSKFDLGARRNLHH
jgi:hypothetical protein